jgi:hypothetical protein
VATFETAREIQSLALLIEDEVIDRLEYVLAEIDKLGEAEDDQVKIAAEMTALTIDLLAYSSSTRGSIQTIARRARSSSVSATRCAPGERRTAEHER